MVLSMKKLIQIFVLVFMLCITQADLCFAYSFKELGSDLAKKILPFVAVLFCMIAFPIGIGFAWKHTPGVGKIGLMIALICLEISLPMALPFDIGKNYRQMWGDLRG
jgi:hypothetical protein